MKEHNPFQPLSDLANEQHDDPMSNLGPTVPDGFAYVTLVAGILIVLLLLMAVLADQIGMYLCVTLFEMIWISVALATARRCRLRPLQIGLNLFAILHAFWLLLELFLAGVLYTRYAMGT